MVERLGTHDKPGAALGASGHYAEQSRNSSSRRSKEWSHFNAIFVPRA
jgi:hypothetical protein